MQKPLESWPTPETIETIRAKFWPLVDKQGEDDCWPWIGPKSKAGYGIFYVAGFRGAPASRVALALHNGGPLQRRSCVCHRCDNPPCCNPAHLFQATHKQNLQDATLKGRTPRKVSDAQVQEIRRAHKASDRVKLAEAFGISRNHANSIYLRKYRKYVAD